MHGFINVTLQILLYLLFFPGKLALYEIVWKSVLELVRPHVTIWPMRIACWITKATNKLSEYGIFIAFTQQKMVTRTGLNVS